jgi:acyl dehydratase
MPKELYRSTGLYFEDFEVGDTAVSQSRTVTESDIVNFIGISGIYEELHMSTEYIRKHSMFGKRIAPGPLTFTFQEGLFVQMGLMHHTGMALLAIENMTWPNPVFCGDTIHVEVEVLAKRETSKPDRGVLTFGHTVRNQTDEIVMTLKKIRLVRRKPAAA